MKALLMPVLVGLPMAAQANVSNIEQLLYGPLLRSLRSSPRLHLLVIEDVSKPMTASARKLLQEDDIADFSLVLRPFNRNREAAKDDTKWSRANTIADALQKHFNLGPEARWAVVDSRERCLASGQDMPSAAELARQLMAAGVQGPMRVLRNFLRTRPDHLEARMFLLRLQRESAEQRTRAALGLELEDTDTHNDLISEAFFGMPAGMANLTRETLARPKPESIPKDKVLETALDLQIWAGYAESFYRLLTGDDWIAADLSFNADDYALEVCSPLVKGLYSRMIGHVEAALERAPLNASLWSVWTRMADVIGGRSIIAVTDRLMPRPGADFSSWPLAVRSRLIEDARANNKWNYLADSLWGEYERRLRGSSGISGGTIDIQPSEENDGIRQLRDSMFSRAWDTFIEPLLEALININDLGRADSIMNTLQEQQKQGQWHETQMPKAIALANRCNRPDIARRWSVYVTAKGNT